MTTEEFNNIAHEKIEEDMATEYQSYLDRFYDVRLKKAVAKETAKAREEVRAEVKEEVKAEVKAEVKEEVRAELKAEVEAEAMASLEQKTKKLILLMLKAKLYSEKEISEQLDVPLSLVQTVHQEMLEKK